MTDPSTLTDVGMGILAVLVLNFSATVVKEVLSYTTKKRNGLPSCIGMATERFNEIHSNDLQRQREAWVHIGTLVQEGDQKIAVILGNQTEILKDRAQRRRV